ncbi:hypothetical protein BABINDRAFT_160897 [Babjeviella inositovora NRRL Y-12698]|uniref:Dolichyl-diphosphooligosaccharide--protein glycosyltransferase subunit 3 n=1 Tax=Babjeviella inositovora NRRL Y-12698 TaxID=984486 RepID=A0A1E3QSL1_9ASCO|nr:uncharacterized protein BABINDRAFT_160897 [Babjeviella inositovora NRRL Y-12698]ODQ80650.1 hypothetical protein BABINDRAFT_160897 [Babjeviella inositovora NRRL Y-12698]
MAKQKSGDVLRITHTNYESIMNGPRDYDLVLLITATDPRVGCHLCTEYNPSFIAIAGEHAKASQGKSNVFFALLDFNEKSRPIFQQMQLQNVPKLYYYPKTAKPTPLTAGFEQMPFMEGSHAENTVNWLLSKFPDHKFSVPLPPTDYASAALTVTFGAVCAYVVYLNLAKVVRNFLGKNVWALASTLTVLMFVSGYMFNSIRDTQYMRYDADKNPIYFVSGHQMQLGVETQIVSFIYGILSIFFVGLVQKLPRSEKLLKNRKAEFAATAAVCVAIFFAYSLLISVFHKKNLGYPYSLANLGVFF